MRGGVRVSRTRALDPCGGGGARATALVPSCNCATGADRGHWALTDVTYAGWPLLTCSMSSARGMAWQPLFFLPPLFNTYYCTRGPSGCGLLAYAGRRAGAAQALMRYGALEEEKHDKRGHKGRRSHGRFGVDPSALRCPREVTRTWHSHTGQGRTGTGADRGIRARMQLWFTPANQPYAYISGGWIGWPIWSPQSSRPQGRRLLIRRRNGRRSQLVWWADAPSHDADHSHRVPALPHDHDHENESVQEHDGCWVCASLLLA